MLQNFLQLKGKTADLCSKGITVPNSSDIWEFCSTLRFALEAGFSVFLKGDQSPGLMEFFIDSLCNVTKPQNLVLPLLCP